MKIGFIISTGAALFLAVLVVFGMGQLADLKKQVSDMKEEQPAKSSIRTTTASRGGTTQPPSSRPSGPAKSGRVAVEDDDSEGEEREDRRDDPRRMIGEWMREWAQSDEGKRMQESRNKRKGARVFGGLVDELGLEGEDRDYFLGVAGASASAEEDLWGKLMSADEAGREAVFTEWESENSAREAAMREFLNDESDWERYQQYESRLEEYEQVQGDIRRSMESAGVPLTPDQEAQLVEVMYEARQESGMNEKWQGRGVMNQISEPGIADRLEADWQAGQEAMSVGVSNVLSAEQVEAFNASQNRSIRGATMGLRMMENFMGGGRGRNRE